MPPFFVASAGILLAACSGSSCSRAPALPPNETAYQPSLKCADGHTFLGGDYQLDQEDRKSNHPDLEARDAARRDRVGHAIQQGTLCSPQDHYYAAMILQHGNSPEHFELAHSLARYAAENGVAEAQWLVGATWDRLAVHLGRPQAFGTQYGFTNSNELCLIVVDETVDDSARQRFNQPPLHVVYKTAARRLRITGQADSKVALLEAGRICPPDVVNR